MTDQVRRAIQLVPAVCTWSSSKQAPNLFCVMYTVVAMGLGLLAQSLA